MRTFHGRLLTSAIESGVPLQPVALRYRRDEDVDELAPFIGDDELTSHLRRLFGEDRATVEIHLLDMLPSIGQDRSQLARRAREMILERIVDEVEEQEIAA
ncbi:hypothetical protein D9M71_666370 [compost metagenome]